ncbi:isorenieratene synthase [Asanoa hainanensis]|uniref:Isorenieratene synthase n=1 Tax=Asanoa hainanensis TaxID=560556 RepID=A0A239N7L0_9ACTN|nr:FAD-dependent oxidoreductase [Asanoa hainanensis]SNT50159.1 isorenieratene synthase [Asanoa hainanensis]
MATLLRRITGNAPRRFDANHTRLGHSVDRRASVVVIGGGIAGVTAALTLAERGLAVTLLERGPRLGGRLTTWPKKLRDGETQVVEHGFHGFFRQYYNWRNVLRRIDPELAFLRPLGRYPVVSRQWPEEDFTGLFGIPPVNLLSLLVRSPSLKWRELRRMDSRAALPLLAFARGETYRRFDAMSAAAFLDSLGLPERARAMLFDVFAHSFFNHQAEMSAAEMIMQFHFYFLRNPEGLDMDAPDSDYEAAIWAPLAARLTALGADVRTAAPVDHLEPGWKVCLVGGARIAAEHVVLAVDPAAAREIVAASPDVVRTSPLFAARVAALRTAAPYAVDRIWLDGDVAADRAPFTSISGEATLDSVTLYHRAERESGQWAARTGGSVLELHAYAAPAGVDASEIADRMRTELTTIWPEVRDLAIVDSDHRVGHDAPAFDLGSDATRPAVRTDLGGLYLAGDWVRMPFPCALMERAASSALLAANAILERHAARPAPVLSVAPSGLLARQKS